MIRISKNKAIIDFDSTDWYIVCKESKDNDDNMKDGGNYYSDDDEYYLVRIGEYKFLTVNFTGVHIGSFEEKIAITKKQANGLLANGFKEVVL